jgi:hypothetical protein
VLGPGKDESREVRILNRILSWTEEGIQYEADPRHAEIMMHEVDCGKAISTPGVKEERPVGSEKEEWQEEMRGAEATKYRGWTARCNFLAQDRPELLYSTKEASRSMAAPRSEDFAKIKRMTRFLKGCPRMVQMFEWQDPVSEVIVYSDADWAGCGETRKSTSGGAVMIGKHLIRAWSSTQSVIALSSGEAELYAIVKATAQGIGMTSMMMDFEDDKRLTVKTDSSAAIGMCQRRGLGKVKHIAVQNLWLQDKVNTGNLFVEKVPGETNIADLMTKHLAEPRMKYLLGLMGFKATEGRAESAPQLTL